MTRKIDRSFEALERAIDDAKVSLENPNPKPGPMLTRAVEALGKALAVEGIEDGSPASANPPGSPRATWRA